MGKYEPRPITEYGAKKIDQVLHYYKACLLNVNTGGGKTYMTIHAVGRLAQKGHLLILTTAKQKNAREFQNSIKSYNEYYHKNFDYFVTNYDRLSEDAHQWEAYNWAKKQPANSVVIICDEAHRIKNPTSRTFKMVRKISQLPATSRVIMATATPHSNSLLDDMSYLILAGFYRNKTQFIRQHVKFTDQYHQPIVKNRAGKIDLKLLNQPEIIIKRLTNISVSIDTEKLLPPRKNFEKQFFFNKTVQKAYRKIQKNWRDGLYDSIAEALAEQRHFVASHSEHRLAYLKQILDSPKRPQTPVLVFYQYNDEYQALVDFIQKEMPDYKYLSVNGKTKSFDPNNPPKSPKTIIIAQYQAAGEGLNAPWSSLSIFFTPSMSAEKYQQARGRNRRAMQKGTVWQFRFVVMKTINEHYWHDLIDNKAKFTKEIKEKMMNYND